LQALLTRFAVTTPGVFLYHPGRRQVLPKLRAFIEHVKHQSADVRREDSQLYQIVMRTLSRFCPAEPGRKKKDPTVSGRALVPRRRGGSAKAADRPSTAQHGGG
jgi:hypothetical protein